MSTVISWVFSVIAICCAASILQELLPSKSKMLKSILSVTILLAIITPIGFLNLDASSFDFSFDDEAIEIREDEMINGIVRNAKKQICSEINDVFLEITGDTPDTIKIETRIDSMNNMSLESIDIKCKHEPSEDLRERAKNEIIRMFQIEKIDVKWGT